MILEFQTTILRRATQQLEINNRINKFQNNMNKAKKEKKNKIGFPISDLWSQNYYNTIMMRSKLGDYQKQLDIETLKEKLMIGEDQKNKRASIKNNKMVDSILSYKKKEPDNRYVRKMIQSVNSRGIKSDAGLTNKQKQKKGVTRKQQVQMNKVYNKQIFDSFGKLIGYCDDFSQQLKDQNTYIETQQSQLVPQIKTVTSIDNDDQSRQYSIKKDLKEYFESRNHRLKMNQNIKTEQSFKLPDVNKRLNEINNQFRFHTYQDVNDDDQ